MANNESYLLAIDPRNTVPGSNIRQVREAHVADLVEKIIANGFSTNAFVSVYEPFPGRAARDLPEDELAKAIFEIRDGAHRVAAVLRLQSDPDHPEYGEDYRLQVKVVPAVDVVVQRALDANAENTVAADGSAKKTFCDELWAMLRVQENVVRRLIAYSSALVPDTNAADAADEGEDADQADDAGNEDEGPGARAKRRAAIINNFPETRSFKKVYREKLAKMLRDNNKTPRVFDPVRDMLLARPSIMIALLEDDGARLFELLPEGRGKELRNVKWRVLRCLVPDGVLLAQTQGYALQTGGSGVVRNPGADTRMWDYMCLVNNCLRAEKNDALSYSKIYPTGLYILAKTSTFCGLLAMTRVVGTTPGTAPAETTTKSRKRSASGARARTAPVKEATIPKQVAAIFGQYDSALRLVPSLGGLDEGLGSFLTINREKLLFEPMAELGVWSAPEERKVLDEQQKTVTTHPKLQVTWDDMVAKDKAIDKECREVAKLFLQDINGVPYADAAAFSTRFGRDSLTSSSPPKITEYVGSRLCALRTLGFRELFENSKTANEGGEGDRNESDLSAQSAGKEIRAAAADSDASSESSEEIQPRQKRRAKGSSSLAAPSPHLIDAQKAVIQHMQTVDRVHMQCAKFQDWGKSDECKELAGKVALILTDPPYNSRRNADAPNSDHDKLSTTDMTVAGDMFCEMLRPGGQMFIFCSYSQWHEWVHALTQCGGGNILRASPTPEIIFHHPQAVRGQGHFSFHRRNAAEVAVHAYKRMTGVEGTNVRDEYARKVAFIDTQLTLLSASDMPAYAAAFNNYRPPVGSQVLRSEGVAVRPEQKSVSLLRDIIRIFAPGPTDIVVDMFAGTMSTVAAALMEGRPVYACEMDKRCFDLGVERIHELAYRRAAAGLVPGLSAAQIQLIKKAVRAKEEAVDVLAEADENEVARVQVQAPVIAPVHAEEEDEITPRID